jgi:hypothetical protein
VADAVVGPHGMTTPECEMQLWAGGFRTLMRAPDGSEYPHQGVFLEIARRTGWCSPMPSAQVGCRRTKPS